MGCPDLRTFHFFLILKEENLNLFFISTIKNIFSQIQNFTTRQINFFL